MATHPELAPLASDDGEASGAETVREGEESAAPTPTSAASMQDAGAVVDLTLSDEDEAVVMAGPVAEQEEDDVTYLSTHRPAHQSFAQPHEDLTRQSSASFKRQMPAWGDNALKRSRSEITRVYGQEISFSVLNKNEVEMRWTGAAPPSVQIVDYVNLCLKQLSVKDPPEMRMLSKDHEKGRFALNMKHYHEFIRITGRMQVESVPIPDEVLLALQKGSTDTTGSLSEQEMAHLSLSIPPKLFASLAPFQKTGVHWGAFTKQGRCLIADEPGLGKTIQAIGVSACYMNEWPLLVITPSSARYHWESEILKWLEDTRDVVNPHTVQVLTSSTKPILEGMKALIVSYDLMDRAKDVLSQVNGGEGFKVIVADECHMLKNQNTKRSKAILPMLKRANRAILLSGTPALSRPKELWSQLNVISEKDWPKFSEFIKRYCKGDPKDSESGNKTASNMSELHTLLRQNCMIRRLKADILKALPPKSRQRVRCEIEDDTSRNSLSNLLSTFLKESSEVAGTRVTKRKHSALADIVQRKAAEQQQQRLQQQQQAESSSLEGEAPFSHDAAVPGGGEHGHASGNGTEEAGEARSAREMAQSRKSMLMQLYRQSGMAKIPGISRVMQSLLSDPEQPKFLVFAHHHGVLDALENGVFRKVPHIRIDGRTSAKERQARIDRFQTDPSIRVALLGITAAGVAITLTAASLAVFTELFWTPAALLQAEDRCHRIGQTRPVKVMYLVSEGSVDELLWPLIQEKMRILGEVVEGKADSTIAVDVDEMDELVEELAKEDQDRPEDADSEESADEDVQAFDSLDDNHPVIILDKTKVPQWRPLSLQRPMGFRTSSMGSSGLRTHVAPSSMLYNQMGSSSTSMHDGEVEFVAVQSGDPHAQHPPANFSLEDLQMDRMRASLGMGGAPESRFELAAHPTSFPDVATSQPPMAFFGRASPSAMQPTFVKVDSFSLDQPGPSSETPQALLSSGPRSSPSLLNFNLTAGGSQPHQSFLAGFSLNQASPPLAPQAHTAQTHAQAQAQPTPMVTDCHHGQQHKHPPQAQMPLQMQPASYAGMPLHVGQTAPAEQQRQQPDMLP